MKQAFEPSCPLPLRHHTIQLAHGGGGRLMRELVQTVFAPAFDNPAARASHDSAVLELAAHGSAGARLAFTTDTYVVAPRFFPGGDIGALAVFGTVNDLAMAGARPRWLSAGFVLEEGLSIDELVRIVGSMRQAAARCDVALVTGDTKVVDRGKADGVFINTTGIGTIAEDVHIAPARVRAGDRVLVSGDLGRHGMAVMSARAGLGFEGDVASDCAPLHMLVAELLAAGLEIRCMRDLTRGGLASALNEIALDRGVDIAIDERAIPVSEGVRGACEMLGLDPLYVACEGRMVAFVSPACAPRALEIMDAHAAGTRAAVIGEVLEAPRSRPGRVTVTSQLGPARVLDLLSGEQLPRIC